MAATADEVTQAIEAAPLATSSHETKRNKKKNSKASRRDRKGKTTRSPKDKDVTLKSRLFEAEINAYKNNLISSSAHMANIDTIDTSASSNVASQEVKKSVNFSQLPEKQNSYLFKYQMVHDKYQSFLSLQSKFEQLPFDLTKNLLLINKGNLIISEVNSIIHNLRQLAQEDIYELLDYKNNIHNTINYLMINLADSLFSKIYIASKDIKEALDKCIVYLEEHLNLKNITVDIYNTLLTMIADVANEYSAASNYSNSSSSSSDSYESEESVSAPIITKVLSDEEAARQLYNRFLPLFDNNKKNTFKQCEKALAKQLTQGQVTAEAYNARLAFIKTFAYPPMTSTTNVFADTPMISTAKVYAALFRAGPSPKITSSLASPTTSNSLTLPETSRLSSVTMDSLSTFYRAEEKANDDSNCKDKATESAPEPASP